MPDSRKVFPGDKIEFSLFDHNRGVDAVRAMLNREHSIKRTPGTIGRKAGGSIPVLNATGEDLTDEFSIVALEEPIIKPDDNEREFLRGPALRGVKPSDENYKLVAVLQGPVAKDGIVDGLLVGVSQCRLDVKDENHFFAGAVIDDCSHLESAASGPVRILWRPPNKTGVQWAVVQVGNMSDEAETPYELTCDWTFEDDQKWPPWATALPLKADEDGLLAKDDEADPVTLYYSMAPRDVQGNYSGHPIGGSGTWVLAIMHEVVVETSSKSYWGILDGDLEEGDCASVSIWMSGPNGDIEDSGIDVTAYDWLMKAPEGEEEEDPNATKQKICKGEKVKIELFSDGYWYVTNSSCRGGGDCSD